MISSLLIELSEKLARPGLLGLAGRKAEKRLREDLERYFRALAKEIEGLHLENAVAHATKEVARHAIRFKVHNALRHRQPILKAILIANLSEGMLKGDQIHHFAEAAGDNDAVELDVVLGQDKLGLSGQEAASWAEQHAAELVTGIDETTTTILEQAISTGIEKQLGVDGTAQLIRQILDDIGAARARTIAATEMNAAFSEAALLKLDRLGIEYKRWICSPDACEEICQDNADDGPIPVDEDFSSGDDRPPAHPNCRCAVVGARAPQEEA